MGKKKKERKKGPPLCCAQPLLWIHRYNMLRYIISISLYWNSPAAAAAAAANRSFISTLFSPLAYQFFVFCFFGESNTKKIEPDPFIFIPPSLCCRRRRLFVSASDIFSSIPHTHRETLFCISFLTGKKIFVSKFTAYDGSDLLKSCWCYPWRLAQTNSAISWLCINVSIRSRFNARILAFFQMQRGSLLNDGGRSGRFSSFQNQKKARVNIEFERKENEKIEGKRTRGALWRFVCLLHLHIYL